MGDSAFVDTNILLRALHNTIPLHLQARTLVEQTWEQDVELWISRQVIREYLTQVSRPGFFAQALPIEQILAHMQTIQSLFRIADETAATTAQLLHLLRVYPSGGKQVHDANIVATMQVYHIPTLLTLNIDDFKRFAPIIKLVTITP